MQTNGHRKYTGTLVPRCISSLFIYKWSPSHVWKAAAVERKNLMAKRAHQNDLKDDRVTESDQALDQAARAAGAAAVAETDRLARDASGGSPEGDATSIIEILGDQTRHSLEAATALGRARNWPRPCRCRATSSAAALAGSGGSNERYLALLRSGMMSLALERPSLTAERGPGLSTKRRLP
jgi:hypothetical protein